MGRAIIKIAAGTLSYLFKYRPYITVWIACYMASGIYESIENRDIGYLIVCVVPAFAPVVIKKILLMISRINGHNAYDDEFFGIAPKGRFIDYLDDYMTK